MSDDPVFPWDDCLARVRAGSDAAARELVTALYPTVAAIVAGRLPRRESVEDMAQEVFMKVFSRLDQYRGEVPFTHWVSRIAVTTCIDALRKQQRRPELRWADLSEEQEAVLSSAEADLEPSGANDRFAARELVNRLLEALPAADRKLIEWLDLEQKSMDEVAELTGWPKVILKVRVFRARRKLQKALSRLKRKESL